MSRAQEWEEELTRRFPSIDCDGVPATAEFIAILEEMGGFEEGVYLNYHSISGDINITFTKSGCVIAPVYVGGLVSSFRCMFPTLSQPYYTVRYIIPTPNGIRDFLSANWLTLFPKEST